MTKFKIEVKDSHRIKEKQDTKTVEEKRQEEKMHKKIFDRTLSSRRALKANDRSNIANLQVPRMDALNAVETLHNLDPLKDFRDLFESENRIYEQLNPIVASTLSAAENLKTLDPIGDQLARMNNTIQDAFQIPNLRTLTNEINAFEAPSKLPDYIPDDQISLENINENIKKLPYGEMLKSNQKTFAKSEEHNAKMIDVMVEIGNTLNDMHQEQVDTNTKLQKLEDTTAISNNIAKWALCIIVLTLIIATLDPPVMQFIESIPFADLWGNLSVWLHSSGEWIEESLRNLQTIFTEKTVPPA